MDIYDKIVGVGELAVSTREGAIIKTFGLGSCVALVLHHAGFMGRPPFGGMAHVALPDSTAYERSRELRTAPAHYADLGFAALLRKMEIVCGADNICGMSAKLIGGANVLVSSKRFSIGKRNIEALRGLLIRHGIPIVAEDVGSNLSRTVFLEVGSGKVTVISPGRNHIIL